MYQLFKKYLNTNTNLFICFPISFYKNMLLHITLLNLETLLKPKKQFNINIFYLIKLYTIQMRIYLFFFWKKMSILSKICWRSMKIRRMNTHKLLPIDYRLSSSIILISKKIKNKYSSNLHNSHFFNWKKYILSLSLKRCYLVQIFRSSMII